MGLQVAQPLVRFLLIARTVAREEMGWMECSATTVAATDSTSDLYRERLAFIFCNPPQITKLRIHEFANLHNLLGNITEHVRVLAKYKRLTLKELLMGADGIEPPASTVSR